MTSDSSEKEARIKRLRQVAFLQKHKRKIGWTMAVCLVVTMLGILPPSHTVISCDDPTIRRTFLKDTISVPVLLSVSLFLPFFVMAILEWALPAPMLDTNKSLFRHALTQAWSYTSDLFVGGLFMFFLNDVAKVAVAEARPNFWDSCRPNITAEQCQEKYISVSWRDCTNPYQLPHARVVDTMKSFPSGHASVSVFSTIFMIVYIQQRLWRRWSLLAGPWLQLLWATWALICCQSRVWDNKHHWWDVLAGGLLGAFGAFITLHYLSNWFDRSPMEDLPPSHLVGSSAHYHRQSDHHHHSSVIYNRNSIKRLISNNSDSDSQAEPKPTPADTRELRDINATP